MSKDNIFYMTLKNVKIKCYFIKYVYILIDTQMLTFLIVESYMRIMLIS